MQMLVQLLSSNKTKFTFLHCDIINLTVVSFKIEFEPIFPACNMGFFCFHFGYSQIITDEQSGNKGLDDKVKEIVQCN